MNHLRLIPCNVRCAATAVFNQLRPDDEQWITHPYQCISSMTLKSLHSKKSYRCNTEKPLWARWRTAILSAMDLCEKSLTSSGGPSLYNFSRCKLASSHVLASKESKSAYSKEWRQMSGNSLCEQNLAHMHCFNLSVTHIQYPKECHDL